MKKMFFGSNAKGRRKYRRFLQRQGKDVHLSLVALSPVLTAKTTEVLVEESPAIAEVLPVVEDGFVVGQEVRIATNDYGKSYKGTKGVVSGVDTDCILVQVPRRKNPLSVFPEHLRKVG